jgi:hypothetical protein
MTHTYRLGAQLQAMAIDAVDLNRFGTHRVPSPQPGITALCRHRIINDRRTVLVVARDAADRLVAAATAATPVDDGVIESHITNFCSGQLIWTRAITPPAHWWSRQPAAHNAPTPRNRIGFSAIGSAEYYLTHDWIPGRDPRATHWLLRSWTPHDGMHHAARDVDIDTALQHVTKLETRARALSIA